ncbi:MAG: helix-turn-helix domain-containing protein [Solirubrobacteraceae bacterium]
MDEFLTVAEVAEMLKLNQQTVRNWIDQGSLPAYHVGRRVRVSRADFDRLVGAGLPRRRVSARPGSAAEHLGRRGPAAGGSSPD